MWSTHLFVLCTDEPVVKHPEHLIAPKPDKLGDSGKVVWCGQQQALGDPGEIAQVENVVKAGGGGWQLVDNVGVELQENICKGARNACRAGQRWWELDTSMVCNKHTVRTFEI